MKILTLAALLAAAFATSATSSTSASAQEVCQNQFTSCVSTCVKDRPPTLQDGCIEVCQTNNSACFARAIKGEPMQETAQKPLDGDDALAATPPLPKTKPSQAKRSPKAKGKAAQKSSQKRAQRRN
jgi:hypothetical protein